MTANYVGTICAIAQTMPSQHNLPILLLFYAKFVPNMPPRHKKGGVPKDRKKQIKTRGYTPTLPILNTTCPPPNTAPPRKLLKSLKNSATFFFTTPGVKFLRAQIM